MLKFPLLVLLLMSALLGCDDMGGDSMVDSLTGDWVRVGYPDCEGTLPLQDLPVEQAFIYTDRLNVDEDDGHLTFSIDGRRVTEGTLHGSDILFVSYGIAIDAVPPLRYAEVSVHRQGAVLDDGATLEFRDRYESYGDFLTCRHEFRAA